MNETYPQRGKLLKAIIGFFCPQVKRREILKHQELVREKSAIVVDKLLHRTHPIVAALYANSLGESEDGLRMKFLSFILRSSLLKKNIGDALQTAIIIKENLKNQLKENDPDLERKLLEFSLLWYLENCYINIAREIIIKLNREFTRAELKILHQSMKKLSPKQINGLLESHEIPPLAEVAALFSVFLKEENG